MDIKIDEFSQYTVETNFERFWNQRIKLFSGWIFRMNFNSFLLSFVGIIQNGFMETSGLALHPSLYAGIVSFRSWLRERKSISCHFVLYDIHGKKWNWKEKLSFFLHGSIDKTVCQSPGKVLGYEKSVLGLEYYLRLTVHLLLQLFSLRARNYTAPGH